MSGTSARAREPRRKGRRRDRLARLLLWVIVVVLPVLLNAIETVHDVAGWLGA